MNVSLTPYLEELIQKKIASGSYNNASEVVREALRLLDDRDQEQEAKLAWLRQEIQEGIDSGPSEPFDMDAIMKEVRTRREARNLREAM